MLKNEDLIKIEERIGMATTQGDWRFYADSKGWVMKLDSGEVRFSKLSPDMEFIAHVRKDIIALLAELRGTGNYRNFRA